jgi:hypothetical protein
MSIRPRSRDLKGRIVSSRRLPQAAFTSFQIFSQSE